MKKQDLLRQHRRHKQRLVMVVLTMISAALIWLPLWLAVAIMALCWLANEAWLSDHLFYSPADDYCYTLVSDWQSMMVCNDGKLARLADAPATSYVLELTVRSSLLGRFYDPYLVIDGQRFDLERGARGRRYVCLSASPHEITATFCQLDTSLRLHGFQHEDVTARRLMIIAPHADDAELAAFGLYSQAKEVMIVTLTQGEIEAQGLQRLGLSGRDAAALKGRLRTWDSVATPLWGNVPQERCVQLGYYCMQLDTMRAHPSVPAPSRESGEDDTRHARRWNRISLPSDANGAPSWENLIADLRALMDDFQPYAIVTPDPDLDPHPDHIAATQALAEALRHTSHQPAFYMLYANHLHNNDRWPMGPAGGGIGLAPQFEAGQARQIYLHPLSPALQLDKAMALGMQHDLQDPLPAKKRIRRLIQRWLTGRHWPATGSNEYFRKAVRSHELFSLRKSLDDKA